MSTLSRVIFDPDVTPPSTPLGLTATAVSESRIDLSWSASTDSGGAGLAGYELLRNSATTIPIGIQTSYSDTGLTSATLYSYRVRARDGNSNTSAYGSTVSATTQSPVTTELYSWDGLTPFAYVDPAKTASGTGTLANPYNPTQGLAIGPAASGDRVILWLPGDWNISLVAPEGYRFAAVRPASGASETRRVIHKAQFPGSITLGARTRVRRTGGAGSILGFYQTDYAIWDGFMLDTKTLLPETSSDAYGEGAQLSAWFSDHCKFVRMYTDHQNAIYPGSNRSNLYMQYCDDMEVADCRFTNIGGDDAVGGNVNLVEIYDVSNLHFHHNDLWNAAFGVWNKGQYEKPNSVYTHRIHHNRIWDCGIGIGTSNVIQTTTPLAVWIYQNLIYECQVGTMVSAYSSGGEPKGILTVNNTIWRGRARSGASEFFGNNIPYGFVYLHSTDTSYSADCLIETRNNALYDVAQVAFTKAGPPYPDAPQYDNMRWDRNLYNTFPTGFWRQGEGGPLASITDWRSQTPGRDINGLTSPPGFVDVNANDVSPATGSALINAGIDDLDLLGNGTSGAINIGAHIRDGDVFGSRVA